MLQQRHASERNHRFPFYILCKLLAHVNARSPLSLALLYIYVCLSLHIIVYTTHTHMNIHMWIENIILYYGWLYA